ncbi:TniB family NTP-binding protein [Streptomyces sp. NBC_00347]|uniref:TniB family NTP-binding protein n=1 Tax=Streptomyces sp. NBC_00347 TaxID=2975721 RepID=UPI0022548D6F|nr:TniB family NTP-binding protein [Streptomyces sp. NBC_00347]MCX5130023.1 TniB family NTP-binding protein [Streptomyces sp. NBC_00347]
MTHEPAQDQSPGECLAPTTWQGWQQFVDTPPPAPPGPGTPARSVEDRLAYHSRFVTVRTPAIDTISTTVRTLMILGRHQQATARPSLIVTGPPTTGKTTALLQVGRTCHLAETARTGMRDQMPVAYVLVPPGASAKTLAAEFARFLGIPITHRMTQAQIMTSVCHTYTRVGVRLVMIDEIHRLNPRTSTGAEATDLLKDLTERIAATFVYAGIDVTSTPLFTGTRGAQLAGRATLIDCDTIPARRGTSQPFRDLTAALEASLDLEQHRPGTLPRLAPYLHTRTAGRIGSLARLLRQAAITAILDGSERITKAGLEAITLDHLAEDHHRPRYPAKHAAPRRRNGNSDGPPARAEPT